MAEPWIKVHAHIGRKSVVFRCASALAVSVPTATGHLVLFWASVSEHTRDGVVSEISDVQIEAWAEWRGKRGRFAKFIRAQHLDSEGRCSEWSEYQGRLFEKRESNARHQQAFRDRRKVDVSLTEGLRNPPRVEESIKALARARAEALVPQAPARSEAAALATAGFPHSGTVSALEGADLPKKKTTRKTAPSNGRTTPTDPRDPTLSLDYERNAAELAEHNIVRARHGEPPLKYRDVYSG